MIKKFLLFLWFQIKSALKTLPKLAICSIVLSVLIVGAGICGNKTLNADNTSSIVIDVALIIPEDDYRINMVLNFIKNMQSLSERCNFIETDEATALEMLDKGEITLAIYLPENFVDGIMYGENYPASVITPKNTQTEAVLFCTTVETGCKTLAYIQSGIYSVDDLLNSHNMSELIPKAEEDLNTYYIKYAINRGRFFKHQVVSATGNVSSAGYYICSGIILLVLMCGLTMSGQFSNYKPEIRQALSRNGIKDVHIRISELTAVTLMFFLLIGSAVIIAQLTFAKELLNISVVGILSILLVIMSIVSFLMFVNTLTDNKLASTLVIFVLSAAMLYACGRILPEVYLPDAVNAIGGLLPAKYWADTLESALFATPSATNILSVILITFIFTGAAIAATKIRGRDR